MVTYSTNINKTKNHPSPQIMEQNNKKLNPRLMITHLVSSNLLNRQHLSCLLCILNCLYCTVITCKTGLWRYGAKHCYLKHVLCVREYPRVDNSSAGSLKHGAQLRTIWPIGLWPVLTTCNFDENEMYLLCIPLFVVLNILNYIVAAHQYIYKALHFNY